MCDELIPTDAYDKLWKYYLKRSIEVIKNKRGRPNILKLDVNNELFTKCKVGLEIQNLFDIEVTFLDIDASNIVRFKRENKVGNGVIGDMRAPPFTECFDVILDLSTIDHVKPTQVPTVIGEYNRILRHGGTLLLFAWCVYPEFLASAENRERLDGQYFLDSGKIKSEIINHFDIKCCREVMDRRIFLKFHEENNKAAPAGLVYGRHVMVEFEAKKI